MENLEIVEKWVWEIENGIKIAVALIVIFLVIVSVLISKKQFALKV